MSREIKATLITIVTLAAIVCSVVFMDEINQAAPYIVVICLMILGVLGSIYFVVWLWMKIYKWLE